MSPQKPIKRPLRNKCNIKSRLNSIVLRALYTGRSLVGFKERTDVAIAVIYYVVVEQEDRPPEIQSKQSMLSEQSASGLEYFTPTQH